MVELCDELVQEVVVLLVIYNLHGSATPSLWNTPSYTALVEALVVIEDDIADD
jgi:hypothetical protein